MSKAPIISSPLTLGSVLNRTDKHAFLNGLSATPGVNLSYKGKNLPDVFHCLAISTPPGPKWTQTFQSDNGRLAIDICYELLAEKNAVRYHGKIRNISDKTAGPIQKIGMLQVFLDREDVGSPIVHGAGGGLNQSFYPPQTFQLFEHTLPSDRPYYRYRGEGPSFVGDGMRYGSNLGRSSNRHLPFFIMSDENDREGVFIGLGWSGDWTLQCLNVTETVILLEAFLPNIDLMLLPGEEIPIPEALIGLYHGNWNQGSNALRSTIYDCFVPKTTRPDGLPPIGYVSWYGNDATLGAGKLHEDMLLPQIDIAKRLGCEFFEIDDGWQGGSENLHDYNDRPIDWEPADSKFPSGMGKVAEYANARGLPFGLWFDMGRTSMRSKLYRNHPEWVLWSKEDKKERAVVNFGIPDVVTWAVDTVQRCIDQYHIGWIRFDYNVDPSYQWEANDPPLRRGITELRHVAGYLRFMDKIRKSNPDVVIELCSSGGRMIDLASIQTANIYFISDHTYNSDITRFHLSGINCFLPGGVLETDFYTFTEKHNDTMFLSRFGSAMAISDDIYNWSESELAYGAKMIGVLKDIKKYLVRDYYPIFRQPTRLQDWDGWQFHDRAENAGIAIVFRVFSAQEEQAIKLHALSADCTYAVKNLLTGETENISGELLTKGLWKLKLQKGGSALFGYSAVQRSVSAL